MKKTLESDVGNYIVEETWKKTKKKKDINNLFGKEKMIDGISNFRIEKAFKNTNDEDIDNNFVGGFSSNKVNKFIDDASMISQKKGKYPFVIAKTDSSSKGGTHWWSILDIETKTHIFFFNSFGIDGLKNFIIQDDKKVIEKILFWTDQMKRTDDKVKLVNIKFNLNACKNLSKKSSMPLVIQLVISFILFKLLGTSLGSRIF